MFALDTSTHAVSTLNFISLFPLNDSCFMQTDKTRLNDLQEWLLVHGRKLLSQPPADWKYLTRPQLSMLEQQAALRVRSRHRFPEPEQWLWSDRSLAQASDWLSACFKASLFPRRAEVLDGCCGAGADAVALAARGAVCAIDNDPWMTALAVNNADAQGLSLATRTTNLDSSAIGAAQWLHVDPDRRPGNRKTLIADQFSPPLQDVLHLANRTRGYAIKLAPSTLFDLDLTHWIAEHCVRVWLGGHCECRQQLLIGNEVQDNLARNLGLPEAVSQRHAIAILLTDGSDRLATALEPSNHYCFAAPAQCESVSLEADVDQFIFDLHPTLHVSGLALAWAHQQNLYPISGQHGYYTGSQSVPGPWAQSFQVMDVIAWDDRKIRKWLRQNQVGQVEVKCRMVTMNANDFQRRYSKPEGRPVTLLVTRIGDRVRAIAAERLQPVH